MPFSGLQPSPFGPALTPHPGYAHPHPAAHIYPAGYFIATTTNAAAVATFQLATAAASCYPGLLFDRAGTWHEHVYKPAPKSTPYSIDDILGNRIRDCSDSPGSPSGTDSSGYLRTPPRLGTARESPSGQMSPPRYQGAMIRDASPDRSSIYVRRNPASPTISFRSRGYVNGIDGVLDFSTKSHKKSGK